MECGLVALLAVQRGIEEEPRPPTSCRSRASRRRGSTACFRCGASGEALGEERSVEAVAIGATLIDEPILVCGPCSDGAEQVLSKKTKEAFDSFVRRVCPTLPADVDLPVGMFSLP